MKIILGSRNAHKLAEMRQLLPELTLEVLPGDVPDAPEEGETFAANARSKSEFYASRTGSYVLADDSGICVDALNGAPGVHSARWAGESCSDIDNNVKLLRELEGQDQRNAHYACVLSLADPNTGEMLSVEGACQGRILDSPTGEDGFGYDPLFHSVDLNCGFAEIDLATKNTVSHRARACQALMIALEKSGLHV